MVASNAVNHGKMRTMQNGQSTATLKQTPNGNGNGMNGHKPSKNGNASSSSGSSSDSMEVAPSPAPPPPEPSNNMVLQSGLIEVNPSMESGSTKNGNDGQKGVNINVNTLHQQRRQKVNGSKRMTMGNGQHHSNGSGRE